MGNLPEIGPATCRPETITISPHWADHHFQGRAILPAVEAMQLLAHWVRRTRPRVRVSAIHQATFNKFLPLPPGKRSIDAFCETADIDTGGVRAALITKTVAKTAKIRRALVHARLDFGSLSPKPPAGVHLSMPDPEGPCFKVDPGRIYTDLVPFGAAYRNITSPLHLWPQGAWAHIQAPDVTDEQTTQPLGSPFVLDAAFHAACIWSQRYAGVVAFPVGIDKRIVHRPTRSGEAYRASVVPLKTDGPQVDFDICITGGDGAVFEELHGVRMRDVSGGRWKPPHWIGSGPSGRN